MFFISISVIGSARPAGCEGLVLRAETDSYSLGPYLEILEDKSGTLKINDVTKPEIEKQFRAGKREVPSFGITDKVYWVRFTLENRRPDTRQWLLELDFPQMDYVDLYLPRGDGSYEIKKSGDMRPFGIREISHRNPVFPVNLISAPQTFYIRVKAKDLVMFPLTIRTYPAFIKSDYRRQWFFGLYYGLMVSMVFYNFFLFLVLKDRSYLYYVAYVFFFTMFSLVFNGFIFPVLFPAHPLINNYFNMTVTILTLVLLIVFSRTFLQSASYAPGFDLCLQVLLVAAILLLPAMALIPPVIFKKLLALHALLVTVVTLPGGIVCYRRGYYPARFFIMARACLQLGAVLFVFGLLGLIPQSFVVRYAIQIGSVLLTRQLNSLS
jgi:hypothetical protein